MNIQHKPLGSSLTFVGRVIDADGNVLQSGMDVNLNPQVGVDYVAGLFMGTQAVISPWYVGVYEGDYTPVKAAKAADLPSVIVESTAYSQTSRPTWDKTYDGVSLITSIDNRASFTFTTAKRLYGCFVVSESAKGGNSGILLSIARFATPYDVPAGSTLELYQYQNVLA
jgi:hypothetical protein